jgi:quercetin dioxygenase-like cupin family protein
MTWGKSEQAASASHFNLLPSPWTNHESRGTTMTRKPVLQTPTAGRTIDVAGGISRFLATGEDTNGKYAMWEAIVPPGSGPPPHVQSREEESFYVLEGEIVFQVEDQRIVGKPGTFANVPVGTLHSFKNESGKPAKMLISVAPAGLENMFIEVGRPVAFGTVTPHLPTKGDMERMLSIAPKYGVEIRLPPH